MKCSNFCCSKSNVLFFTGHETSISLFTVSFNGCNVLLPCFNWCNKDLATFGFMPDLFLNLCITSRNACSWIQEIASPVRHIFMWLNADALSQLLSSTTLRNCSMKISTSIEPFYFEDLSPPTKTDAGSKILCSGTQAIGADAGVIRSLTRGGLDAGEFCKLTLHLGVERGWCTLVLSTTAQGSVSHWSTSV